MNDETNTATPTETLASTPAATPPATPAGTPAAAATPPKLYAGKFATIEDLEKGYVEAQKLIGKRATPTEAKPAETPATPAAEATPEEKPAATEDKPAEAKPTVKPIVIDVAAVFSEQTGDDPLLRITKAAGLDPAAVGKQFLEKGELTPEMYAAFNLVSDPAMFPKGIPKAIVDQQLTNQLALQDAKADFQARLPRLAAEYVGGTDKLQNIMDYARQLPPEKVQSIDQRLNHPTTYKLALQEIVEHMDANPVNGRGTIVTGGGSAAASSSAPFASSAEYRAEMREATRRSGSWQNDPEFMRRASVTPRSIRTAP